MWQVYLQEVLMNKLVVLATAIFMSLLAISGCSTPAPNQILPRLTYLHMAPLSFAVEKVEIDNRYKAPNDPAYIENWFPTSPETAIRTWAKERLKHVGNLGSGTLLIVINQASVRKYNLNLDTSLKGTFTKQQSNRYDVNIDVALELIDRTGKKVGFSAAQATRSITTREDISLNDRDRLWLEITEKTMEDFNREIETNVRQYLAAWLR
jgi:hypothetical protein